MKTKDLMRRAGALALAAMLAMSLCACGGMGGGKAPTAEELVAGVSKPDPDKYNSMRMSMDMHGVEDGQEAAVKLAMAVDAAGGISHMRDVEVTIESQGFSMTIAMEGWLDENADTAYMNVSAMGEESGWTKSSLEDAGMDMSAATDMAGDISKLWPEGTELTLKDHKKGEDYEVSWAIGEDAMSAILGDAEDLSGESMSFDTANGTACFDEGDRSLKSIRIDAEGEDGNMTFLLEYLETNGDKTLSVPQDVIDAAAGSEIIDTETDSEGDAGSGNGWDGTYTTAEGGYQTDDDGWDDLIDGMATAIQAKISGDDTVQVTHYSDYADLEFSHYEDQWHGNVEIMNVTSDEYGGAPTYFEHEAAFAEEWHHGADPARSSDDVVLYMGDDGELDYVMRDGDLLVVASVYHYEPEDADLEACLKSVLDIAGVDYK